MISHENGIFEFRLGADPALVAVIRRSALEFAERLVSQRDLPRLEVAVHELLENSVKYMLSGTIEFRLQISRPPHQRVVITTRNTTETRHIELLRREIAQISKADRALYYQEAMIRAMRSSGVSGLGLSRIAAESQMDLSCSLVGTQEVEVRAEARLTAD